MRALLDELKSAIAGLARAPAFTALAAGVLGLGLGAVIFMYGVADTLMLEPPPYPNADRIGMQASYSGDEAVEGFRAFKERRSPGWVHPDLRVEGRI